MHSPGTPPVAVFATTLRAGKPGPINIIGMRPNDGALSIDIKDIPYLINTLSGIQPPGIDAGTGKRVRVSKTPGVPALSGPPTKTAGGK
jgi:hypothetical protein